MAGTEEIFKLKNPPDFDAYVGQLESVVFFIEVEQLTSHTHQIGITASISLNFKNININILINFIAKTALKRIKFSLSLKEI